MSAPEQRQEFLTGKELHEIIQKREGKPVPVVISDWKFVDLPDKRSGEKIRKIFLSFEGKNKGWVFHPRGEVNEQVETLLGEDRDSWVGMKIELTTEDTKFGPGIRPGTFCERVAPPKSKDIEDSEPF